jgi:soluble lytic murein transglycosylase-like protein
MGLMQLMPDTAQELGVKNCYNPVENIMAGTRYLKSLLNRYDGNVELTLAAYNWGMGNVERHPDRLPKETLTYIARVSGYLREGTT